MRQEVIAESYVSFDIDRLHNEQSIPQKREYVYREVTVSNIWEIAVIVEMLEPLGRIIEMGQRVAKGTTH